MPDFIHIAKMDIQNNMTALTGMATKIPDAFHGFVAEMSPSHGGTSMIVSAVIGVVTILVFLTFKSMFSRNVLPGVPNTKGFPFLEQRPPT